MLSKLFKSKTEIAQLEAEHCRAFCDELRSLLTKSRERECYLQAMYNDAAAINARLTSEIEKVKAVANKQASYATMLANKNAALHAEILAIRSKEPTNG